MNGLNGRVDGLEMKKGKWEKDVDYLTRWAKGPANSDRAARSQRGQGYSL